MTKRLMCDVNIFKCIYTVHIYINLWTSPHPSLCCIRALKISAILMISTRGPVSFLGSDINDTEERGPRVALLG